MKTGSFNRPWVELEDNRPPRVDDHYKYWSEPPPELSERCVYWVRQIVGRGWLPSRKIRQQDYDSAASWFGVYLWEYLHILVPYMANENPTMDLRTSCPCGLVLFPINPYITDVVLDQLISHLEQTVLYLRSQA